MESERRGQLDSDAIETVPRLSAKLPPSSPSRVPFMDLLRIWACYMVVMVHSCELFYIGPNDTVVRDHVYGTGLYGSWLRACVPLFVVVSGYFLLPIRSGHSGTTGAGAFLQRRLPRVVGPFVVWAVIHILYYQRFRSPAELAQRVLLIGVNWTSSAPHLWFVYMLLGLYAFAPIISPWLRQVSEQEERYFLLGWAATLLLPVVRVYMPTLQVWGEAFWNPIGASYYFSGYLGYFVLGHYLRCHVCLSAALSRCLGAFLLLSGYAFTYWTFTSHLRSPSPITLDQLELTWAFTTFHAAVMVVGYYLLFKDLQWPIQNTPVQHWLTWLSRLSFGVYLAHVIVLEQVHVVMTHVWPAGLTFIPAQALLTFVLTYALIALFACLPYSWLLVGD
eukprot:TRINITY_DN8598_c0_g2_i1.p1 TRINITY_DN8598_c0_g2~~TRINITY_DN8598_c0_g2_i1.p1  ORF type:complete len:408 (-),score=17.68 TRINITY_DN8598_c0_g2_i1:39-1208(-)